jgi:thiamine-phosphate pyrophosphorylase
MRKDIDLSLYLVTDRDLSLGRSLEEVVTEAVAGGVTIVQLREKGASTGEFVELARRLMGVLKPLGIPLIINDRVDVALAVDADGVHIGQSDMTYADARRLLGPDKIIGLSVESFEDIEAANALDVDYIGISPVYGTPTKRDTAEPFGLEGLRKGVEMSAHPTVAIGGMNSATIGDVMEAGADGVAVVSAICSAENIAEATANLKAIVGRHSKKLWSRYIWRKSLKIYNAILELPFLKELSEGRLSNDIFGRYIAQDEIYLKNYYHQMNMLAELMDDDQDRDLFLSFAQSGMEGEKAMHDMLIEKYGIDTEVTSSEVTSGYNAHICEGIATGNPCIALAAVLPCMWIYNMVGLHILQTAKLEDNPYKEWILEYGQEEFTNGVNQVLKMIDGLASKADKETREKMDYYYLKAALYEYAFWDYGYHGDTKSYDYTGSLEEWL